MNPRNFESLKDVRLPKALVLQVLGDQIVSLKVGTET